MNSCVNGTLLLGSSLLKHFLFSSTCSVRFWRELLRGTAIEYPEYDFITLPDAPLPYTIIQDGVIPFRASRPKWAYYATDVSN